MGSMQSLVQFKQECIPVGCVPPAAGVGCLPQCMLGYPPGVGLETPPGQTPQCLPWVWAWRPPPGQTPQLPHWVWAWRPARHAGIPPPGYLQDMLEYHLQCMLGYHPPPWTEFLTHASENITLPKTLFAGGKDQRCRSQKVVTLTVCPNKPYA